MKNLTIPAIIKPSKFLIQAATESPTLTAFIKIGSTTPETLLIRHEPGSDPGAAAVARLPYLRDYTVVGLAYLCAIGKHATVRHTANALRGSEGRELVTLTEEVPPASPVSLCFSDFFVNRTHVLHCTGTRERPVLLAAETFSLGMIATVATIVPYLNEADAGPARRVILVATTLVMPASAFRKLA